ncbi:hypothetical protein [Acinetobacter sp. 2JN-4]|uniref:hypothetical protein n=1 Tax=Acinetobacter sp. 2JN-4 TaxID=2479844 RepID=UPI001BC8898D|nr:hypothetical protein [Acinetobacter sp. 2JN-4]
MNFKLISISVLTVFLITGCGSDKKVGGSVEKNILTIQAEEFNDKIKLNLKVGNYSLSAKGNDPDVTLSFWEFDKLNDFFYGDLRLIAENKKASFATLAWGSNYKYSFLFCISYLECADNTSYRFDEVGRKLKVSFKKNSNQLIRDYVEEAERESARAIPATISGDLEFKIPSNWLAFNKNRFPEIKKKGSLKFDDQTYQLSVIDSDVVFYRDGSGEYISSVDHLNFKNDEETISIHIYQGVAESNSFKDTRLEIINYNKKGKLNFSFDDFVPASFISWTDNGKILSINMENLKLYDKERDINKILNINFDIPRNISNLSLNNENVLLSTSRIDFAYVINDQKIYAINLKNYSESYFLNIIQEFNGNLSIESVDGESKITCGDRNNSCLGLSINSDKKTFKFDNVKLGKDVLNGTIYIAGVLNSR